MTAETARGRGALSRFTPSLMSHEQLERLFVARERTLQAVMARIEAAATSAERNHTLLVGPRGSGKTHLVSLAYHRTNLLRDVGASLQVAWLPEDAWTIVSYRHLLTAIAERLEPAGEWDVPASADALEALLVRVAGAHGPIVVVVENLDQVLEAIGDDGQQRLRHLLQARRPLLLVATTTRIDRALSDQASPFYAFFTTTRLEPFGVDEAAEMLRAVARERGDDALAEYLTSAQGHRRLQTIAHLAGGQPRMWAVLASALTIGGLSELVELLLTRFDDLTPYYQEQLHRLSAHQRLVVAELARLDRPMNVGELAHRVGVDQRSLAKTMSDLADRGWIAPMESAIGRMLDQRRTYYELAEPLARIAFQIKEAHGAPLGLVIEFLKHWFDPPELHGADAGGLMLEYQLLATAEQDADPVLAVTRRLQSLPLTRAPAAALLGEVDEALEALEDGDPEPLLRLPTVVRRALEGKLEPSARTQTRAMVHRIAQEELGFERGPAMASWIVRAERWVVSTVEHETTTVQLLLADWLGRAWRFDEAEQVLAAVVDSVGSDKLAVHRTRFNLVAARLSAGDVAEAIESHERVLADRERLLGAEHPDTLLARALLAASYELAGRTAEAIELGERAVADSEHLLGAEHPHTLVARALLAGSYGSAGRIAEAIELGERAVAGCERVLGAEHYTTTAARECLATFRAGRPRAAAKARPGRA